jgi:hypothetical protein
VRIVSPYSPLCCICCSAAPKRVQVGGVNGFEHRIDCSSTTHAPIYRVHDNTQPGPGYYTCCILRVARVKYHPTSVVVESLELCTDHRSPTTDHRPSPTDRQPPPSMPCRDLYDITISIQCVVSHSTLFL